jgi:hypothetical protein
LKLALLLTVATIASLALIFLTQEAQRAQTWLKYNFLYNQATQSSIRHPKWMTKKEYTGKFPPAQAAKVELYLL